MAEHPREYRWSSYALRLDAAGDCWLDEYPGYGESGETAAAARDRYIRFVEQETPGKETALLRTSLQRGQLTGDVHCIDEVERLTGRRIERRAPGNQPQPRIK